MVLELCCKKKKRHTLNVGHAAMTCGGHHICQGPERVWGDNREKNDFFFCPWEENETAALYLDQNAIFTILGESCPRVTDCKKSIPSSFEVGLCRKRRCILGESNTWTASSVQSLSRVRLFATPRSSSEKSNPASLLSKMGEECYSDLLG